jgi:hypothetical protein
MYVAGLSGKSWTFWKSTIIGNIHRERLDRSASTTGFSGDGIGRWRSHLSPTADF